MLVRVISNFHRNRIENFNNYEKNNFIITIKHNINKL
jgi:hypothetical protein